MQLAGQFNQGICPDYTPISFDSALQLEMDRWGVVHNDGIQAWRHHIRMWVEKQYLGSAHGDTGNFMDLVSGAGLMDVGGILHSETGRAILDRIFEKVRQARVLSLVRNGIFGCTGINREIAGRLAPGIGHRGWGREGLFCRGHDHDRSQ